MTTKPSPGTLDKVRWTFATVAAMKAEDRLIVGDMVETRGYLSPGDGGGWFYTIAASGTAVDGYVDHALDSGLKAVLDHGSTFHAEWAGAVNGVECSAQINAAWAHIRDWKAAQSNNPDVLFCHSSTGTLANAVGIQTAAIGRLVGVNVNFANSSLTAVAGGDLSASVPMLTARIKGDAMWGTLDGGKFAAGFNFVACTGSRFANPVAVHFKGYGMRVAGASGAMEITAPLLNEYDPTDTEFNTQANFTARGISCESGDWVCAHPNVKWCGVLVYIAAAVVGMHFVNPHLANGNPNFAAGQEPLILLGMGQSNMLGQATATDGDHSILSGVYVSDATVSANHTGYITAAFGTAPFNRGSSPYANNMLIHAANALRTATGRTVYLIMIADGGRKIECFLKPDTLTENGWTAAVNFSAYMYPNIVNACADVPGRVSACPDLILWEQGGANAADTAEGYALKLDALIADLKSEGVIEPGTTKMTIGELALANPYYTTHKTAINLVADSDPELAVIVSNSLTDVGDGLHFDGASLVIRGQRHAAAFTFGALATGGPPFVSPVLVENYATRTNHMLNGYYDNGLVHDYSGTLNIGGGHYVKNSRAAMSHPYIRIYATSAEQRTAPGSNISDLGGKCSVGFVDNGPFTWAGDWASLAPQYNVMDDDNNAAQVMRTNFRVFSASVAKVEHNYKPEGKFRVEWQVGADKLVVNYDPAEAMFEVVGKVKGTTLASSVYEVADLPDAATQGVGSRAMVSDANATTFASVVAAGGANVVPVYSDGTDWRIG